MKTQGFGSTFTLAVIALAFGAVRNVDASTISASARRNHGNVDTLSWGACGGKLLPPLECASFRVPLDWADKSKGKIKLAVIRLPHDPAQPREGYMFYNPGGPGDSGLSLIGAIGDTLHNQIGRSWDVVSWDPRGVGKSEPNITLFDSDAARAEFWSPTVGVGHFDAHGNLTTQPDIDFFMSQAPTFDGLLQSWNDKYVEKFGNTLRYIGTATTVRDLVALTEAIYGRGVDINFHGYSYGTVVGAYLTQMFPDRIGKVIIDGVVDVLGWANTTPMEVIPTWFETSEKALQGFASYCAAAPDKCVLAQVATTASDIIAFLDQIYATAYQIYDGSSFLNPDGSISITGLTVTDLSSLIFGSLYDPSQWKDLADSAVAARAAQLNITGGSGDGNNATESKRPELFTKLRHHKVPFGLAPNVATLPDSTAVIACGDMIDPSGSTNSTTEDLFKIIVNVAKTITPHFASVFALQAPCHRWTSRAVERLPVPFTTKPKNVVLVIGNSADPVTPYSSARKLASEQQLGNMARLIKLNAVGHASVSNNSTCIDNVIHSYLRGTIPEDAGNDEADVECEIDRNPFDNF